MSTEENTVNDTEWEKNSEDIKYDEIDSVEELEEKKQAYNTFAIDNNNAQNQIFINENAGGIFINFNGNARKIKLDDYKGKKYNLQKSDECIEFVQIYQNSQYLATAIVLSVFKAVFLTDLPDLQDKMYSFLPEHKNKEFAEQEEIYNPYVATNTILAVIGGQIIDVETKESYVIMEGKSVDVLINILKQFPLLHKPIIQFLSYLISEDRYQTKMYCEMLASTLAEIYVLGIMNFRDELIPVLYNNPNRYYLWGRFVCELYEKNDSNASKFLKKWISEQSYRNWRNVCFLYILLKENNYCFPYMDTLREIIDYRIKAGKKADYYFMSLLLIRSSDFADLVCEVFYQLSVKEYSRTQMQKWAHSYLYLVKGSYYRINRYNNELPLVACQNKQQQQNLTKILEAVMASYNLRKQIYVILQTYLKELSLYDYDIKTIKHIAAFCRNLAVNDDEYREEIEEWLSELNKSAAKEVAKFF